MWHTLASVAESRRIDAKLLKDFALAHEDSYGIVVESGEPEVNTWHVDKLVADFKAHNAAASKGCPVVTVTLGLEPGGD